VKSSDGGHIASVARHRSFQRGGGRSQWREQRFDKAPGLVGIQLNQIALIDDLASDFTAVRNDKCGHGATLNRGRFPEKLSVRLRHACDKSPAFSFFCYRWHAPNVCLRGTHCKN